MTDSPLNTNIDVHEYFLLEPYFLDGEGVYSMTFMKVVKGTESYMEFATKKGLCQNVESTQDCYTRSFLKSSFLNCKCRPYGMEQIESFELKTNSTGESASFDPSTLQYCSPHGLECFFGTTNNNTECVPPCAGIYADIVHVSNQDLWQQKEFIELRSEYEMYKRAYMEPVQYPQELESKNQQAGAKQGQFQ